MGDRHHPYGVGLQLHSSERDEAVYRANADSYNPGKIVGRLL
jgi:hypothetical protein